MQRRADPALLLLGRAVRDEGREGPGPDRQVGPGHTGGRQLLVDDELLQRRGPPAPRRRPVRHDQPRLGDGRSSVGLPRRRHLGHDGADLLAQRLGLGRQVGRQVAPGAGDGQGGHLVLERADVAAGEQLQVGHGPLQVEVGIVLPGEADAPEQLDALLGAVRGRPQGHGAGDACAQVAIA